MQSIKDAVDRSMKESLEAIEKANIPEYQHESRADFVKTLEAKTGALTKNALGAKKKIAAAECCLQLAGCEHNLEPARLGVNQALSAVSTYTVAKLVDHSAWAELANNAENSDSGSFKTLMARRDEVVAALKEAVEFIHANPGVDLPPALEADATSKISSHKSKEPLQ